MKTYEFDGEKYKIASTPQKEWGQSLISEISLQGNLCPQKVTMRI